MTAPAQGDKATFKVWRGEGTDGHFENYSTSVSEGMVVLDAIHQIQAESANDLAVRWNCKAGKCGSCSAEVNGMGKERIYGCARADDVLPHQGLLLANRLGMHSR